MTRLIDYSEAEKKAVRGMDPNRTETKQKMGQLVSSDPDYYGIDNDGFCIDQEKTTLEKRISWCGCFH